MITLPVSSSVYQSMVANIQQIHTNGDGTLCITPMQVQKNGLHNNGIVNTNCSVNNSHNSSTINSVCSNINQNAMLLPNNHNSQFTGTMNVTIGSQNINNTTHSNNHHHNNNNSNNNLLELCRALNQTTQYSKNSNLNSISLNRNNNKMKKPQLQQTNNGLLTENVCHQTNLSHETVNVNINNNNNNNNVPSTTNNNIKFEHFSPNINANLLNATNQIENENTANNETDPGIDSKANKMKCESDIV